MTIVAGHAVRRTGPGSRRPRRAEPARRAGRRTAPANAPAKSLTSDVLATIGLAVFSLAVAAGFARVFAGWNFFDNLAVLVVVGHGVGLAARRLRLANWLTIPIVALVLFWTIGVMFYGSTYSWGLPSGDTWTLFSAELDLVREQFHVAVAPVPDVGGWPVLAAIGMAFAICLSDAFAFGALARAEALVPGGVLFVFISALGDDRLRVQLSVVLVGAGVAATVVLRAHHAPGGIRAKGQATRRVIWQAVATATIVALLAGWVGQRLPGARSEALFDTRGNGDGSGSSLSPLVDIRSRLTNQTDRGADRRDLERRVVLALDDAARVRRVDVEAGRPCRRRRPTSIWYAARPPELAIRQKVSIVGLTGTMIPVAPDPTAATGPDRERRSATIAGRRRSPPPTTSRPATSSSSCRPHHGSTRRRSPRRPPTVPSTRSTSNCPTTSPRWRHRRRWT